MTTTLDLFKHENPDWAKPVVITLPAEDTLYCRWDSMIGLQLAPEQSPATPWACYMVARSMRDHYSWMSSSRPKWDDHSHLWVDYQFVLTEESEGTLARDVHDKYQTVTTPPKRTWQVVPMRTTVNNELTNVPEELLALLGEPIDWTPQVKWSMQTHAMSGPRATASAVEWNGLVHPDSYNSHHSTHIDEHGGISLLGDASTTLDSFLAAAGDTKTTCIRLKNMYRGGGNLPEVELLEQTAKQIANNGRLFLYRSKIVVIDKTNRTPYLADCIQLGMFTSLDKVKKYSRIRQFLLKLVQQAKKQTLTQLLKPELWAAELRNRAKKFTRHSDSLLRLATDPEAFYSLQLRQPKPTLDDAGCSQMGNSASLRSTNEYLTYQREQKQLEKQQRRQVSIENKYSAITAETTTLAKCIRRDNRSYETTLQGIADLQTGLETIASRIRRNKDNLERIKIKNAEELDSINTVRASVYKLTEDVATSFKTYQSAAKKHLKAPASMPWFAPLADMGVKVISIKYSNGIHSSDIMSDPSVLCAKGYTLSEVVFVTTEPHIICVDRHEKGDECEKIVGGPYQMKIRVGGRLGVEGYVRLAAEDGVFGYPADTGSSYTVELFVHPHAEPQTVIREASKMAETLTGRWFDACLGEAGIAAIHSFKNNDPRGVIYSCLTWLNCANSADDWGRNWVMFPPPSMVHNLPQAATPEPTQEEITPIIKNADGTVSIFNSNDMLTNTEAMSDSTVETDLNW